jgi:acyl dehydratase
MGGSAHPDWKTRMVRATQESLPGLAGTEIGVSDWLTIDQGRIDKFAEATGDHQWIHVDVARAAKEIPGGKTIAHGFLTLSLIPMLTKGLLEIEGVKTGINYGSDRVRFTSMVPVGSRVRARQKLVSGTPKSGGLQLIDEVTVEIEGETRPALIAEVIRLLYF